MVGGIRPSAGVVLPLLPPALLHYTINRRKLQAVRQKFVQKKVKMLGGCALRGTGSPCRCGKLNGGACPDVAGAAGVSDTRRGACPVGRLPTLPLPSFLPPIPPAPFPGGEGGDYKFISPGAPPLASPGLGGARHGHCLWKTGSFGFNGALAPAGAAGTRVVKSSPRRAPIRRVCKCRRRFSAGVPGAKPPAK